MPFDRPSGSPVVIRFATPLAQINSALAEVRRKLWEVFRLFCCSPSVPRRFFSRRFAKRIGQLALIHCNLSLANEVLESEPTIDGQRDQIIDTLLSAAKEDPSLVAANIQYILAVRHQERIADHTTNIAEDLMFWLRGLDIRHHRNSSGTRDTGNRAA